jgi:hypothetical protein
MRIRNKLMAAAAVSATVVLGLTAAVSSAHAEVKHECKETSDNFMEFCPFVSFSNSRAVPWASVTVGPDGGTFVTECKVTSWLTLSSVPPGAEGASWESPKKTSSCMPSVNHRGDTYSYTGTATGTSARYAFTKTCIDLYYDGSTHSGWQDCLITGWAKNN